MDLTFGNATILNADGADLVIFETVFEENFDIAVYTGDTLSSPQTYWSVDTGPHRWGCCRHYKHSYA